MTTSSIDDHNLKPIMLPRPFPAMAPAQLEQAVPPAGVGSSGTVQVVPSAGLAGLVQAVPPAERAETHTASKVYLIIGMAIERGDALETHTTAPLMDYKTPLQWHSRASMISNVLCLRATLVSNWAIWLSEIQGVTVGTQPL